MLKPVKRKGTPFYVARGTIDGRRIERSTGTTVHAIAKQRCIEFLKDFEPEKPVEAGPYKFEEAVRDYMDQGGQTRYLPKLVDYFANVTCDEITNKVLNDAALSLYPNAAPATINRQLLTPMGAIINLAADSRLCLPLKVRRRKEPPPRDLFMTPDEAERLIEATHGVRNKHFPALVTFLIGQGCRVGETLQINAARDVDLENGFVTLRADTTKGGYTRRVTLIPRVRAALSTLDTIGRDGALFHTDKGEPYRTAGDHGGQIAQAFGSCVQAAGLSLKITPHICRHTWATWFYAQTRDPLRLKREGGWKKNTWERYTKLHPGLGDDVRAHGWEFNHVQSQTTHPKKATAV